MNDFAPEAPDDVRTWPVWDPLRPHAMRVIELAEAENVEQPVSTLLNELPVLLKTKGIFSQAEPLYRRALTIDERSFGNDHPNVARNLNNLAALLKDTNWLAEAVSFPISPPHPQSKISPPCPPEPSLAPGIR